MINRLLPDLSTPARIRAWLQTRNGRLALLAAAAGLFALFVLAAYTYQLEWTGFTGDTDAGPKTLWDWMDLALIPLVLGVGGYLVDRSLKQREQASLQDQHREESLQIYFDRMTELIVDRSLLDPDDEIMAVARARTLTVIRRLDAARTADLMRFLCESGLINVIDLSDAALRGIDLQRARLRGATLRNADLTGADLHAADLRNADLAGAALNATRLTYADLCSATLDAANLADSTLERATISGATLTNANLVNARFLEADLSKSSFDQVDLRNATLTGTDLSEATLTNADLRGADLRGAILKGTTLSTATLDGASLAAARYDAGTQWPDGFTPPADALQVDARS